MNKNTTPAVNINSNEQRAITQHANDSASTVGNDSAVADRDSTFSRSPTNSTVRSNLTSSTRKLEGRASTSTRASTIADVEDVKQHPRERLGRLLISQNSSSVAEGSERGRSRSPRARYGRGLQRPSTHQWGRARRNSFRETAKELISSIEKPKISSPTSQGSTPKEKGSPTVASPESVVGRLSRERKTRSFEADESHRNVHTYAGRHSNDWLFGGWSIGGSVKKLFEKK